MDVAVRTSGSEEDHHPAPAEMLETVDLLSNWTATTINAVRTVGVVGWETYSEVLFSDSNSNPNHGNGDNGTEHNPRQTPARICCHTAC